MMWFFFLHCESVMIGFGFLIQMRFTLSMVNRFLWCVVKRNIFGMRKSILMVMVMVMGMIVLRRYL